MPKQSLASALGVNFDTKAGKLRCIATGTRERLLQLPDVLTVAEQGCPNFEMTQWESAERPATAA